LEHFNKFAKVGRSFNKFPIYISTAVDHFQSCAQRASTGQCMSNIPNGRTDTDACVPCTCCSRIIDSSIPRSHHRRTNK
ncbi:hypothetical protein T05_12121, partial [Trichinella murrelli]